MSKYLMFLDETPEGRKTSITAVLSRKWGYRLGTIKWYGAWRQYTFWPENGMIFNVECMQDIQNYIKELSEHRKELLQDRRNS